MFQWFRRMLQPPISTHATEEAGSPPTRYARFTDMARKVMLLASQEAHRLNHEYIGTEHILLGVTFPTEGVAVTILKSCDISPPTVWFALEPLLVHGPYAESLTIDWRPHTPTADRALLWASEEARFLNHDFICTEHLLLGLLHEHQSVAAEVLNNLGLTVERARDEVIRLSPPGREGQRS